MEEQMSAKQKRHWHVKNGLASCRLDDLWKSNCYAGSIQYAYTCGYFVALLRRAYAYSK